MCVCVCVCVCACVAFSFLSSSVCLGVFCVGGWILPTSCGLFLSHFFCTHSDKGIKLVLPLSKRLAWVNRLKKGTHKHTQTHTETDRQTDRHAHSLTHTLTQTQAQQTTLIPNRRERWKQCRISASRKETNFSKGARMILPGTRCGTRLLPFPLRLLLLLPHVSTLAPSPKCVYYFLCSRHCTALPTHSLIVFFVLDCLLLLCGSCRIFCG